MADSCDITSSYEVVIYGFNIKIVMNVIKSV